MAMTTDMFKNDKPKKTKKESKVVKEITEEVLDSVEEETVEEVAVVDEPTVNKEELFNTNPPVDRRKRKKARRTGRRG